MCMFSGPVEYVRNTRIFARLSGTGTQFVVYSMSYSADRELAMILPLPVTSRDEDTAVRFLALDSYVDFFKDMVKGFPCLNPANHERLSLGDSPVQQRRTLKVHEVGAYDASFVPTLSDFDRLDARFTLPAHVWDGLPQYQDYGFAVFKLRVPKKEKSGEEAHPMAFEFATRLPGTLFFPTVHVHDGEVHERAEFDHHLYYQGEDIVHPAKMAFVNGVVVPLEELLSIAREDYRLFQEQVRSGAVALESRTGRLYGLRGLGTQDPYASIEKAARFVDVQKAKGIVEGQQTCRALVLQGMLPNHDILLHPTGSAA